MKKTNNNNNSNNSYNKNCSDKIIFFIVIPLFVQSVHVVDYKYILWIT
jgi:hypothetical protein